MVGKNKKKAAPLNSFFRYIEAGGSFKGEILAGISMGLLSVCCMFMNMQLVLQYVTVDYFSADSNVIAANGEIVASTWFAAMIVAAIGTIAMGLIARRPFVQVAGLSFSCVLVSTLSIKSGLSYNNMLAIVFVGNVAYLAVAAVPVLRKLFVDALPRSVRLAIPAAAGLLMAYVASQLSGLFIVAKRDVVAYGSQQILGVGTAVLSGTSSISTYSYLTDAYHPQMLLSAVACVLAIAVYLFSARKTRTSPYLRALLAGTLFFLVASALLVGVIWRTKGFSFNYLWARLWMVGSEDAMQAHLASALGTIKIGTVLTRGFDFSGYEAEGGSAGLAVASGALNYLFLFLYDAQSTVDSCNDIAKVDEPASAMLPMLVNGAANVAASMLGVAPVALGKESVAGTRDKGRSGLAAVLAGAIMLISAFVWVVPALFCTITNYSVQFNMYGHYGKVLQLLTMCSFSVVDVVMMVCGLMMAGRAIGKGISGAVERAPFIATIVATFLLSNLACGVACGMIAHVLVSASPKARKKGAGPTGLIERVGGVEKLIVSAALVVMLIVWIM